VKGDFSDTDDDHIMPEKPFATPPVWLRDSEGVIFGDLYDEYLVKPGTEQVTQLTHGRKDNQQYRYLSVAEDQEPQKLGDKLYFHVFDRDSKAAGFYSCDATGQGKVLAMDNVTFGSLFKAKDADRVLFVMGSYEKSPDVYVTNTAFSAVKPESHTNPQQANFAWGHTELVNYKSRWGAPLQGVLIYPANYQAGKTYPMVTYIYEKESDELNHYVGPDPLDPYNVQILSQTGYFVFKPDITYRQKRTPGQDAQDCLEPAVQAVLAKNVGVDPKHIGLMGHSWGAYQTAFVTTVSKMFAVGIAGAPLTELTSMYNSYYWNSGATDQESFESGQGRMGVPFWEDPKPYIDNSPVWRARERTSPILFAAGTNDGAVDFDQSLYLYNTLRRLGKEAVLLVYPGENHSLASKPVREDYGRRVRQYLGVYLKGETPEKWISEGVPFIKRDEAP
jgi:dipeptidyl aminopeptidase/acylaminoacyl peptidase